MNRSIGASWPPVSRRLSKNAQPVFLRTSSLIGAKVLEKLRAIDEVAYLRYASVYQRFQDVDQFVDAIHTLGRRVKPNSLQRELFPPESGQNPAHGSHKIPMSKNHGRV
jgi:hypothetical protein